MDFGDTYTRLLGGVSDEAIQAFEARRGLRLPAEYRSFVAEHGAGVVGIHEVFGLAGKRLHLDHVLDDLVGRGFQLPRGLLPIAEVGDGSYVALACVQSEELEAGQVGFWNPRKDDVVDVQVGPDSFGSWIEARR